MEEDRPNKNSNPSAQQDTGDTNGKRKEDVTVQALLLQDVFSDSGSAPGSSQKTSCQSDTGQRKGAQLEKK